MAERRDRSVAIRRAVAADARPLAMFAARSFTLAFGSDNSARDMALHIAATLCEGKQRAEIADPDFVTLLVEAGDVLAGYLQIRSGESPPCVALPDALELLRFYVDSSFHGKGVARALMEAAEATALSCGSPAMWLGVWEHNARARRFYRKCGFRDVGTQDFMLGNDRQSDVVMLRELPPV